MRINIMIDSLNIGGAERVAVLTANELSRRGNEITITYWGKYHKDDNFCDFIDREVIIHKVSGKSYFERIAKSIAICRKNKTQVIFAHLFSAHIISAVTGQVLHCPVYWFDHDMKKWHKYRHLLALRILCRLSMVKLVIPVSKALRNVLVKKCRISPEKIRVLHNPLCLEVSASNSENNGHRSGIFRFGYIGRIVDIKRTEYFVDLAEYLIKEKLTFQIVIAGEGTAKSNLVRLIKEKNLENYFFLMGYTRNVDKFYRKIDVFCNLSSEEAYPSSILEAAKFGVPSIAFDVGGNEEIIQNGKSGIIVKDGDIDSYAEKIIYLAEHEEERRQMGECARGNVLENNTPEQYVSDLLGLTNIQNK